MLRNYMTIMVVPAKNGRIIRFQLSAFVIRFVILLLLIFLIISAAMFFDYMRIKKKSNSLREIEKTLILQKISIKKIDNELEGKKKELDELERFDRNLRLIAGLQESRSRIRYVAANSGENSHKTESDRLNIQDKLQKLDIETKLREISFFQLTAYLQEQKDRLARTPSIAPTSGYISSPFGYRKDPFTGKRRFHAGIDFSTREYTPVYAPADGVVDNSYLDRDFGHFLVIDHGYHVVTRYGHLSKIEVKAGTKVKRGDLIARVGNTGRSTAPHLHYEVLINDQYQDPEKFIFWDR